MGVVTFKMLLNGQEMNPAHQLLSIEVTHEVNRVPTATLIIRDGEAANETFPVSDSEDFVPGKELVIKLGYDAREKQVFKGIIVRHGTKIRQAGSVLVIECKHPVMKMTVGKKNAYFTEQKDSEIMESLIRQYGLIANVESTTTTHEEVTQFETTDWDFMLTRADMNGKLVLAGDDKVKIEKPIFNQRPVLTATFGSTILEFDAEMDAMLQPKSVKALGWSHADQEVSEADAQEPGTGSQGNISAADLADVVGLDPLTVQHGGALAKEVLQSIANAQLLKLRMAKIRGRVKFQGNADVQPGSVISLQGVGDRFNGDVFVTAVNHSVAQGNWETDVQFGIDPDWFAASTGIAAAGGHGLFPPVQGLHTGVVTALESDPAGEDRILVRLPMVSPNAAGTWARVATLDAGENRGSFFRPEIGDEVVVGFMNGDPGQPMVLGMLNSSAKPSPMTASDDNHIKGFVSRSEMKWLFDDEKKIITFETPAGNKVILDDDNGGITIEDQNGNTIKMDSNGIEIKSAKDLKITATGDAEIEGVNVKAGRCQQDQH